MKSPVVGLIVAFTLLGIGSQGYITKLKADSKAFSSAVTKSNQKLTELKALNSEFRDALDFFPDDQLSIDQSTSEVLVGLYQATQGTSVRIAGINSEAFSQGRSPQAAAREIAGLGVKRIDLVVRLNWKDYDSLKTFTQRIQTLPVFIKQGKLENNNIDLIISVLGT